MFQGGGVVSEDGGLVGVPIRLVVHLYKEQRIIIDLFMDRQNRWRPIEMRHGDCTYLPGYWQCGGIHKNKWRARGSERAGLLFVPPPL